MSLLDECIAAYGGLERWHSTPTRRLHVSAEGLAFARRGRRRLFADARVCVSTRSDEQRVEIADWPCPGTDATFTNTGCRIGDAFRAEPRWGRRWDDLDFLAFAGAALWTYVSLPFVIARWDVSELPGRRLRIRVPDDRRSHCAEQVLHLDEHGLIVRHDYTAEAFGRWARAAHRSSCFEDQDGIPVPLRRRVRPRPAGPVIVSIDVAPCVSRSAGSSAR